MTRDEITHLAREAGFVGMDGDHGALRRFAALVAAAEREACAKVCEVLRPFGPELALQKATAEDCAAAIRARGNSEAA